MAQTYTQLFYHLVFSTKNRTPLILPAWQADLYSYIGGVVRNRRGELCAAGGVADHVHLLVRLSADRAVADAVRDIKALSSGWRHENGDRSFAWQTGYGAFTVSRSMVERVTRYINRQEEHHRTITFRDEFLELLRCHGVDYNERYLWD